MAREKAANLVPHTITETAVYSVGQAQAALGLRDSTIRANSGRDG